MDFVHLMNESACFIDDKGCVVIVCLIWGWGVLAWETADAGYFLLFADRGQEV